MDPLSLRLKSTAFSIDKSQNTPLAFPPQRLCRASHS